MPEREPPPIPISWVSKEDCLACRPDLREQIEGMSANEVAAIGRQIGDALQETYHLALDVILTDQFGAAPDTTPDVSTPIDFIGNSQIATGRYNFPLPMTGSGSEGIVNP